MRDHVIIPQIENNGASLYGLCKKCGKTFFLEDCDHVSVHAGAKEDYHGWFKPGCDRKTEY